MYPTLDRPKSMQSDANEVIEKNTGVAWNKWGIYIDKISDPLVAFAIKVISHKLFYSSQLNSVSYMEVDLSYKIIKRDHSYDLFELQLQ